MKDFKRGLGLNCNQKEDWTTNIFNNIGSQMLKILCFQMVLNTCEMWSNDIKIAFFFKKLWKIAQRPPAAGGSTSDPVCDTFELTVHFFSQQFR